VRNRQPVFRQTGVAPYPKTPKVWTFALSNYGEHLPLEGDRADVWLMKKTSSPLFWLPYPRPLITGRLIRRYNRFLADVELDSGERVVAHCVNTGRMEGLVAARGRVWLSESDNPARTLRYTWEIVEIGGVLVGANTGIPNRLVRGVLEARALPGLKRWTEMRAEKKYGENSRVDFWLKEGRREHFIEVKNCHLVYPDGFGYFPDSVSERATKHLEELVEIVRQGHRATVIFTAQRADTKAMRPSDIHDPVFAAAARHAAQEGVRFRAVRVVPAATGLLVEKEIPVDLGPYATEPMKAWREASATASGWVQVKRAPAA